MADENKWLAMFQEFISHMRIDSKEVASVDDRGSPLDMWDSQRIFLEAICAGLMDGIRTFLFLKSRQLGISTISLAIDIFWLAVHPGTIGALVTDTEKNRSAFRATLVRYVASFPKGFLGKSFKITKNNRDFMLFSNGSRLDMLVAGTSEKKSSWGEGQGYSFAHLTEIANYGSAAGLESFQEALAENHPDRLFIYESTAKGMNHWRDMWIDAGRDVHTKSRTFIGFWAKKFNRIERTDRRFEIYAAAPPDETELEKMALVLERHGVTIEPEQLAWRRWKDSKEGADEDMLQQNQPWIEEEAFVLSGKSFFPIRFIEEDLNRIQNPENPVAYLGYRYYMGMDFFSVKTEKIEDQERADEVELRVWHEPVKGAQYTIGCDPAYGRNEWKDRHAINVFRCYADKLVQCAEYASREIDTRQCAWVLSHLAGAYRDCIVNLELTGPGRAVMVEFDSLRERLRADMYQKLAEERDWEDFLSNARWYMYHRPDSMGAGFLYNTEMSFRLKFEMMNQLRDNYSTRLIDISSAPLLSEMIVVTQEGNEIGAPGRQKDDRVFSMSLANAAWLKWVRPRMITEGMTYDLVSAEERGEVNKGQIVIDRIVANFFRRKEEEAEMEPHAPQWMIDRGLA